MSPQPTIGPVMTGLEQWRYWRCFACRSPELPNGHDFETARPGQSPKCPKCGAMAPALLAEMIPTHFLFEDPGKGLLGEGGKFRLACQPGVKEMIAWQHHSTGEPGNVSCKRCQDTKEFQAMKAIEDAGSSGPSGLLVEEKDKATF